jgi:hypothetical protein
MKPNVEWCSRCFVAPPAADEKFSPPDAFLGPPLPRGYSRTVKTDVSMGLMGRIVATLLLCVIPVLAGITYVFPFGVLYLMAACPVLVPAIWKKTPLPANKAGGVRAMGQSL